MKRLDLIMVTLFAFTIANGLYAGDPQQDKPRGTIRIKKIPQRLYIQACVYSWEGKTAGQYFRENFNANTRCRTQPLFRPVTDTSKDGKVPFDFTNYFKTSIKVPYPADPTCLDTVYIKYVIDQRFVTQKCEVVISSGKAIAEASPLEKACLETAAKLDKWNFFNVGDKPANNSENIHFILRIVLSNKPLTILYDGEK